MYGQKSDTTTWTRYEKKEVELKGLKVRVCSHAWEKISGWCKAADSEVSGMGMVKRVGSVFTVYDAHLLEQECTGAYTELKPDALANYIQWLAKRRKRLADCRLWWHTHCN